MCEERLPDPKFKFMQKIDNKHLGGIEVASKTLNKSILVNGDKKVWGN
jgi:hypothetical protein